MKTPRIEAFVANKKQVPKLKSSLDHMPAIEKPQRLTPKASPTPAAELPLADSSPQVSTDRATARPVDEATGRPGTKRILVRRGFECYEDQLNALKRLSIQEQLEGKQGSMSAMVREAVDDYLKKKSVKS